MKKVLGGVAIFALILTSFSVLAGLNDTATMEERIAPVGKVCMQGESCAKVVVQLAAGEARTGSAVYTSGCAACHTTGAAGAPKLGDKAGWGDRLAKGNDVLYTNAIKGYNGMPAKGLCADCSDAEIKGAVDHMLDSLK